MSVTDDSDNEKVQDAGVWLLKSYWRSIVVDIKKKKTTYMFYKITVII